MWIAKELVELHNLTIRMFFSGFIHFNVLLDHNQYKDQRACSFYLISLHIFRKYWRG